MRPPRGAGRPGRGQRGNHQLALPSSCMIEGTRTIRTRVASTRMATARPRPNTSRTRSGSPMTNDPKTQTMMAAAAVMTRPVEAIPSATAAPVIPGAAPFLLDAGEQEDLVVHGQPEGDGEHHQRDPRVDRPGPADREDRREPAPLVDGDDGPVSGPDRQQVHGRGLERDGDRAEHGHEQEERHQDHQADHQGSRWDRYADASIPAAVSPPTKTFTSLPAVAWGITVARRCWTKDAVAAAWGAVVG